MLGTACRDGEGDEGVSLWVQADRGPAAQRQQFATALDQALELGHKVLTLVERRIEIGTAQKEAILNAAQCACLLMRFCVETKLTHLLRALRPPELEELVQDASRRLQDLFLQCAGLSQQVDPEQRQQLALRILCCASVFSLD